MNKSVIIVSVIGVIIFMLYQNGKLSSDITDEELQKLSVVAHGDTSGHVKPKHLLYDVLQKYSNGDKMSLQGACKVNLHTKDIIDVDLKVEAKKVLNHIFKKIYKITHNLFEVQELNNIYEQMDSVGNKRYIMDATLHSVSNYYTVKVIVDVVMFRGDVYINYVNVNEASNNNIINRYDMINYNQGILQNHNNFTENIRKLLDTHYKKNYKVIGVEDSTINYDLNKVLSLKSMINMYYPSTVSSESRDNLSSKGLKDYLEMYFPPNMNEVESPQFCNKYSNDWSSRGILFKGNENCVFNHNTTSTEYNQPYNAPGLFFKRSSHR